MENGTLEHLRTVCLALPETAEVESWGTPTFRVKDRIFAMHAGPDERRGYQRTSVWCKAKPVTQDMLLRAEPERYFAPPYVGPKGWVGIWLDDSTDWEALRGLVHDAYRLTAPKQLLAKLGDEEGGPPKRTPARRSKRSR
jgi:hypothetical protein